MTPPSDSPYPGSYDDNLADSRDRQSSPPRKGVGYDGPRIASMFGYGQPVEGQGHDPDSGEGLDYEVSENGSILDDLSTQAGNVERGLVSMPLDAARDSLLRWSSTLEMLADPKLDRVSQSLTELRRALGEPLDGRRIGTLLARAGMETRVIAAERTGAIGMALDRLADGLIFAGNSLAQESH